MLVIDAELQETHVSIEMRAAIRIDFDKPSAIFAHMTPD